jgi:hypothetical protein
MTRKEDCRRLTRDGDPEGKRRQAAPEALAWPA